MTSQAWPAGRCGNNASGIDEDVHVAFLDTVFEDLLSCRNDDSSYIIMYFFAFEDLGSQCHVFQTTVGAGADNDLLDRYVAYLVDSLRVFRQMFPLSVYPECFFLPGAVGPEKPFCP